MDKPFQKDNRFISGRLKSLLFASRGAILLVKTEHSIISQLIIGIVLSIFGFVIGISKTEWMFQILAIGLVLCTEGINTAVEKVADFIHPNYHQKIGFIKDIAAGAVFFAALTAVIIGLIIYIPYFF